MRDAFIESLSKIANNDKNIFLITGDLGYGVLDDFAEKFPSQFLNVGVAEQNMTGIAVGMALNGYKVFTYSIANFTTLRCLEQIRNDACYHNANVNIVSIGGGFGYGGLGMSHHATEDLAIMRSLPNLTVISPCGLWETMEATEALVSTPGTCYLRLDKSVGDDAPNNNERFEIGKLKPIQVAIISIIEDARVELLSIKEFPGLRELWLPYHLATGESKNLNKVENIKLNEIKRGKLHSLESVKDQIKLLIIEEKKQTVLSEEIDKLYENYEIVLPLEEV